MAAKPIRVSQVNSYIKRILQNDPILGNISVIGEISNLKFHSSGHIYFSLKDADSKINCFLASSNSGNLNFVLEEGKEVIADGYIYLYERGGSYSLNIRHMEEEGKGDLSKAYEMLKAKLEAEGLFSKAHKKALPFFPQKIAVVTSATGAAIKDILKIIKKKNNYVDIIIYPVIVQGPEAHKDISKAIDDINSNFHDVDLIITGRGGGSTEELWAFNEESVARSIFASKIPVISAVGHETDFTIADFVADIRAETPTAAAEIAVPDIDELKKSLLNLKVELKRNLNHICVYSKNRLEMKNPKSFLNDVQGRIHIEQMKNDSLKDFIIAEINNKLKEGRHKAELFKESIETSNPKSILNRGYSLITDMNGSIINDATMLKPDQIINIETANGEAKARVEEVTGKEQ